MSDYVSIGNNVHTLDMAPAFPAYTGVMLWYDDEHAYSAGDDSGRVLTATCPWATQQMADDMLASILGYAYRPYEATGAILPPEAELGDAIFVGGIRSVLASLDTTFDGLCSSDISAPADEEIDHEYPYLSPMARELSRKVALGKSYYGTTITKAKGIEIVGMNADGTATQRRGLFNADVFAFYDDEGEALYFDPVARRFKFAGDVAIVGGTININDKFVVDAEGNVAMSGSISWGSNSPYKSQFSEDGESWHDKMTADDLYRRDTYDGGVTWGDAYQFRGVDGEDGENGSDAKVPNYIQDTYIDFDSVESPVIIGNVIRTLGTFEVGYCETDDFQNDFVGTGFMGYAEGLGAGGIVTYGVAMSNTDSLAEGDNYVIVTDAGSRMQGFENSVYVSEDVIGIEAAAGKTVRIKVGSKTYNFTETGMTEV